LRVLPIARACEHAPYVLPIARACEHARHALKAFFSRRWTL